MGIPATISSKLGVNNYQSRIEIIYTEVIDYIYLQSYVFAVIILKMKEIKKRNKCDYVHYDMFTQSDPIIYMMVYNTQGGHIDNDMYAQR